MVVRKKIAQKKKQRVGDKQLLKKVQVVSKDESRQVSRLVAMSDADRHVWRFCVFLLLISLLAIVALGSLSRGLDTITGQVVADIGEVESDDVEEVVVQDVLLGKEEALSAFNGVVDTITGQVAADTGEIESSDIGEPMVAQNLLSGSEEALSALMDAEADKTEMVGHEMTIFLVDDILLDAKRAFIGHRRGQFQTIVAAEDDAVKRRYLESLVQVAEDTPIYEIERLNYTKVVSLVELIKLRKQQAFHGMDTIALVEDKEERYRSEGINTSLGIYFLADGKIVFKEERYEEASGLLEKADVALEEAKTEYERVEGLLQLSKNFFVLYWWQTILVLIILALITPKAIHKMRKRSAKGKLKMLELEQKSLKRLMKKTQNEYFNKRSITEATYNVRVKAYKERVAKIKHTIPVLKSIITGKKVEPVKKKWKVLKVSWSKK